jgi:hypothetical protein
MQALALPLTVLRPMAFMELMTDKAFFPPVSTWYVTGRSCGCALTISARSRSERSPTRTGSSVRT